MSRSLALITMGCLLFAAPESLQAQGTPSRQEKVFVSGNIRVDWFLQRVNNDPVRKYNLFRDGIFWGSCLNDEKFCRMPMAYYHSQGPLGMVFQKFDWFPGPVNIYRADARLPTSLIGQGALPGPSAIFSQLSALWSEPPVAVIGMEAGTPAAYARPYQQFHFYEPNKEIIDLNERTPGYFKFVSQARSRGAAIAVFHGSPRQQLVQCAPHKYYHLMIMEACSGEDGEKLFLDLLTKEGIAECMEHIADDGILCVHTSHLNIDLPPLLAAIGRELQLYVREGHDQSPGTDWGISVELAEMGHSLSQWVVFARHKRILDEVCKTPPNYEELLTKSNFRAYGPQAYWRTPKVSKNLWTDKGPNLMHGVLRGHPLSMRYLAVVWPVVDQLRSALGSFGHAPPVDKFLSDISRLSLSTQAWLVERQLADYPDVRELWGYQVILAPKSLKSQPKSDKPFTSGNIRIRSYKERVKDELVERCHFYRDNITYSMWLNDDRYCRMPMTYYHPQGPLGVVFQKFNWFPGSVNTYAADVRLPASLIGQGALPGPASIFSQLGALWSEPPVAVIGMQAGTPAAYARPYQQFHFYDPSKKLIDLNEQTPAITPFVSQARSRGAAVAVFHGSPRQQLTQHGPRRYYHLMVMEACSGENSEKIFLELLTKEGIAECMEHLADDGILCVHTSHMFVDLPPILAAIGDALQLYVREGHDMAPDADRARSEGDLADYGHYVSQWVLIARNKRTLDEACKTPANYNELLQKSEFRFEDRPYWSIPQASKNLWTDKGPNLMHGVLRGHPIEMRYLAGVMPIVEGLETAVRAFGGPRRMGDFLYDMGRLPRPIGDWLVHRQLADFPDVRDLWP